VGAAKGGDVMGRKEFDDFINFDSPELKRRMMGFVGTLHGLYEVVFKPRRNTRSTQANRYYFGAVVTPFYEFLREQEPLINDKRQAHIEIKKLVLGTFQVRIGNTISEVVPTTHDMDSPTFWDFVERARVALWDKVGLPTLDPGEYGIESVASGAANSCAGGM
jgi:hypothetical protein